jgi:membrane dipeptidase
MVTFVPAFVSPEVAAWEAQAKEQTTAIKEAVTDSVEQKRRFDEWKGTHPRPSATLKQVADHIEHVRQVAGIDHVGIGSDFDGIDAVPVGLEDVSTFPFLFAELARRGWSDADLKKLAGENVLRVLTRAEEVAARLQRERPPSTKTIAELDGRRAN